MIHSLSTIHVYVLNSDDWLNANLRTSEGKMVNAQHCLKVGFNFWVQKRKFSVFSVNTRHNYIQAVIWQPKLFSLMCCQSFLDTGALLACLWHTAAWPLFQMMLKFANCFMKQVSWNCDNHMVRMSVHV